MATIETVPHQSFFLNPLYFVLFYCSIINVYVRIHVVLILVIFSPLPPFPSFYLIGTGINCFLLLFNERKNV